MQEQPQQSQEPLPAQSNQTTQNTQGVPIQNLPKKFVQLGRKKQAIFIGCILLAVIILVAGFIFFRSGSQETTATTPYDFKEPQAFASATAEIKIPMDKVPEGAFTYDGNETVEPVRLFSDKGLTQEINSGEYMSFYAQNDKEVVVGPRGGASNFYNPDTKENVVLGSEATRNQWNYRDTYYVVQYYGKNGKELERPIVYPYTMTRTLDIPQVASSVNTQGHVELRWEKVEGAEKYYVVKYDNNGGIFFGETDANTTSWNSSKFDEPDVRVQNGYFSNVVRTEDETRAKGYVGDPYSSEAGETPTYELGVIAIKGDTHSSLGTTNLRDILPKIPYESAANATREIPAFTAIALDSIEEIPTSLPFTVASGRTVSQPLLIDTAVKESRSVFIQGKGMVNTLRVKATIKGTNLSRYFQIQNYDPANIDASLAAIAKRNEEAQLKTGALTTYAYTTESGAVKPGEASKERPQVDFPIFASNDTVDYIAANLIKGNKYIDMSNYDTPSNQIGINDAVLEAVSQNPYIMYVTGFQYYPKEKILTVDFDETKERIAENQKKVQSEAKRIVADITNASMTPRQKVEAINKYIVDTVSYDYNALAVVDNPIRVGEYKDAWTAYGALFEKQVVCGGYAMLFTTLAREAGLETVYVSGYVGETTLHAWNMVKLDGKWVVVDTTWNDSITEPNKYLGISLEKAKEQRSQSETTTWMSDIYLAQYL